MTGDRSPGKIPSLYEAIKQKREDAKKEALDVLKE